MENHSMIVFNTVDGKTSIDVRLENDTVWLNAQQMALLFGRDDKTIRKHINNAIKEELSGEVVVAKFATTTPHGEVPGKTQEHEVSYYNLDVIISVGYRVKSMRVVGFCRRGLRQPSAGWLSSELHFSSGPRCLQKALGC